jgi:hypothetical protein
MENIMKKSILALILGLGCMSAAHASTHLHSIQVTTVSHSASFEQLGTAPDGTPTGANWFTEVVSYGGHTYSLLRDASLAWSNTDQLDDGQTLNADVDGTVMTVYYTSGGRQKKIKFRFSGLQ